MRYRTAKRKKQNVETRSDLSHRLSQDGIRTDIEQNRIDTLKRRMHGLDANNADGKNFVRLKRLHGLRK